MLILKKIFSFATLTLMVALTLSTIASWYSVLGLTAIFSAAVVPIMIMGGSLEFAKVVTTVWLHKYWHRAGWKLKLYLVPAVIMLAFLTSMGIFGYLSKAHSDQSLISGDIRAKIAVYDEKIKTAKDNIEADRKSLQQMDAAVDQTLGRTTDEKGASHAVSIRRSQTVERNRLNNDIQSTQESIAKLNEEAAPIRAEVRKVDAEVGPIKYIAAFIYGDNPDNNLLERAVRWVIMIIVFVFDPLALTLVLAAQSSYEWLEEDLHKEDEEQNKKSMEEFNCVENGDMYCDHVHKCVTDEVLFSDNVPINLHVADDIVPQQTPASAEKINTIEDVIENDEIVPTDDAAPDGILGEELSEALIPNTDEHDSELEQSQENHVSESTVKPEIQTEGVTYHEMDHGYVEFDGKHMNKSALLSMHPNLFAAALTDNKSGTGFGTEFPKFAAKDDVFVRVDALPNRVYKFDGNKWSEINKLLSDSYLFDEEYLRHLVNKIETNEYDVELLSENEREQIKDYLHRTGNTDN